MVKKNRFMIVAGAIAAFLLVALASGCGGDQQQVETSAPPLADTGGRIQLAEATFDFGSVPVGRKVEHAFTIKNTGSGPLQLGQLAVKRLEGC